MGGGVVVWMTEWCSRRVSVRWVGALLLVAIEAGCPMPPRRPGETKVAVWGWRFPSFVDDQGTASLKLAVERTIAAARRRKDAATIQNAERFLAVIASPDPDTRRTAIAHAFRLMRVRDPLLLTAYYEPELQARRTPDAQYRFPIYSRPPDLLDVDPAGLDPSCQCRLQAGRLENERVVPYPARRDIAAGALAGRGLELAWTDDPFTLFSLHVQGSGQLVLPDGSRIAARYAGTNGRPYKSLGRALIDRGYLDGGVTWDRIREVMGPLPDAERDDLFATNERFTFFRLTHGLATGSYGTELVPERSVAVDPKLVPLGSIGYLVTPTTQRFVVAQDTGAAVRDAHADLFLGFGPGVEARASRVKETGTLYVLTPR
jgi:membrane-bound lytic murein transglycosylase A